MSASMMTISRARELLEAELIAGSYDESALFTGIQYDSRSVARGDVFFCIDGQHADGHHFAAQAIDSGAVALVVQRQVLDVDTRIPQFRVDNVRKALAQTSAEFWGYPSRHMKVFGITGTNGKTTTTYLIDSIARAGSARTGIVGTISTVVDQRELPAERTTPESRDLQELLAQMAKEEVSVVSMEVSSHSLELDRVTGVEFAAVGFTNLTQDHLDYHGSMDVYFAAKRTLFTDYVAHKKIVDIDTLAGQELAEILSDTDDVVTVGRNKDACIHVILERPELQGTYFEVSTPDGVCAISLPLFGHYNVSNALVAIGCTWAAGWSLDTISTGLSQASQVPGRLERISLGQPFEVLVDYAHTPDALENVLGAVRKVTTGKVITVFGCGGDRDPVKRPLMGMAASAGSDYVVITSDNPRTELPKSILDQVECGVATGRTPYVVVEDRREAITFALGAAAAGDCVVIAGKGHETYQDVAGVKHHFDDREEARNALVSLGWTVSN